MDAMYVLTLAGKSFYAIGLLIYYCGLCLIKQFVPYEKRCKSIKGEVVLLTGAGSGIGRLLAKKMAKQEATIVCVDINTAANEETVKSIKQSGGNAVGFTCDLSKREDIYRVADEIKKFGQVDILVNNAGIVTGKKFLESSDVAIQRTMDVNINAHFWLGKCFFPHMLEKDRGHLVTIASMAGQIGCTGLGDYCASKFAAVGFEESMRYEFQRLNKFGIQTTVVCPFYIDTGMFEGVNSALIPILSQDYASDKILEAILTNQRILFMPKLMYSILFLKGMLPEEVQNYLATSIFRTNNSMDSFMGRAKKD